jgi:hypothetical protein
MFATNPFAQLELVIAVWTVAICTHVLNHFTTKLIKQSQILQMLATNPLVHSEFVIAVWTVAVVYTCLESPHSETGSAVDAITDLTGVTQFRFRHGRKYTFVCRVWKLGFVRLPVQPPLLQHLLFLIVAICMIPISECRDSCFLNGRFACGTFYLSTFSLSHLTLVSVGMV